MDLIDKAIIFATNAHSGQKRKLSYTPYILHPLEVANIIATMTDDEETMVAGVLHDTIEDCGVLPEEIYAQFGKRVFALVQSETEDKMPNMSKAESWKIRKEDSLLMLEKATDINVKILWLADKISNMRSFYREYLKSKDAIWQKMNQKDPKMHAWYYRSIAKCVKELENTSAYAEYLELINKVFGEE